MAFTSSQHKPVLRVCTSFLLKWLWLDHGVCIVSKENDLVFKIDEGEIIGQDFHN